MTTMALVRREAWTSAASHRHDTHESKRDPENRLSRKGKTASEPRFIGHTLMDNRHGLIVNARVTWADGHAERQVALSIVSDARQIDPQATITRGADKGYDARELVQNLHEIQVVPHVAQNKSGRRSAVPDEIAREPGYEMSMQCRKRIEQGFGWAKTIGSIRQVMVRGLKKVDQLFVLNMADNLVRMRSLGQVRLQTAG